MRKLISSIEVMWFVAPLFCCFAESVAYFFDKQILYDFFDLAVLVVCQKLDLNPSNSRKMKSSTALAIGGCWLLATGKSAVFKSCI